MSGFARTFIGALPRRRVHRWLGGRWSLAAAAPAIGWAAIVHAPAALAFPHRAEFGTTTILSERPIGPELRAVVARADRLTAASPLAAPGLARTVVLTDGGWRWRVLAATSAGAFGLRRPFGSALIFNRSDAGADRVWNGRAIGGSRTLSGTIAHETTHVLVARRYGELHAASLPLWKREGYPDYVARESSLPPVDAARLRKAEPNAPALGYFDARRRVAAELARNGGSVDRLLR